MELWDVLPPSVGHVVTCDESLSVILSHILHSIQLGLSVRVSYWLAWWLTMCVDCGWHSIKLPTSIQLEWSPSVFKLYWNSCTLHDHFIVLLILYWLYKSSTPIVAPFCQFYAYLSVFFVRLCFQLLDHCDKLISCISVLSYASFFTCYSFR